MDDLTATMGIATVIIFLCIVMAYFCGWLAHTASKRYQTMKEELEIAKERLEMERRMNEWRAELIKEEPPEEGEPYDFSGFRHTAGYWHAGNPDMKSGLGNNLFGKYIYGDGFDCRIAVALECDIKDWEEVMANARLMAYSPQMLELLTEMYKCDKLEQRRRTSMSLLFDAIKGIKR